MNLKIVSSALLVSALIAPAAFASTGTITFTGSINNITCLVNGEAPGSAASSFNVDIGPVSQADLPNVGDIAGTTGFRIRIGGPGDTACVDGTNVWAQFEPGSTVDVATGALIVDAATGSSAQGVQIRLLNKNGDQIDIYGDQQIVKEVVAGNEAVLGYAAGYQRTGAMVGGVANSSVVYSVRFEAP